MSGSEGFLDWFPRFAGLIALGLLLIGVGAHLNRRRAKREPEKSRKAYPETDAGNPAIFAALVQHGDGGSSGHGHCGSDGAGDSGGGGGGGE